MTGGTYRDPPVYVDGEGVRPEARTAVLRGGHRPRERVAAAFRLEQRGRAHVSPIDLIPDFIPGIGYLYDALVLPVLIWLVLRLIPKDVIAECRNRQKQNVSVKQTGPRDGLPAVRNP